MLDKAYYCYMVASESGTLYVGFTGALRKRVWRHKTHEFAGFTDRYNCERLVWAEVFPDPWEAIAREKQLKRWRRDKKVALIQSANRGWLDLAAGWFDPEDLARARAENEQKRKGR